MIQIFLSKLEVFFNLGDVLLLISYLRLTEGILCADLIVSLVLSISFGFRTFQLDS